MSGQDIRFTIKGGYKYATDIAAVGSPSDFYVYDVKRTGGDNWSGWIKSSDSSMDYWYRFAELKKKNDRTGFQKLVDELFVKFPHK